MGKEEGREGESLMSSCWLRCQQNIRHLPFAKGSGESLLQTSSTRKPEKDFLQGLVVIGQGIMAEN